MKWYGRYLREGLLGLRTRPRPGRPPFVSRRDMKKIWRVAKKTACWTAKGMLDLIKTVSGIEYEIPHVRALLRGRGYTMMVPVDRHVHRAGRQKIAGFQRRMRRLIPGKGADGCIRCVQDETVVMADARARRGVYTLRGKHAVYTYTGFHAMTVVFGLITDDGRSFFKRYDRFTKDELADFLREAHAQFGRSIMMILDRAPQHKAKIIQETLKDLGGAVELEFLSPGCPDLNAIEEVWRQMKRAVLGIPYVTVAGMHEDVDRWLDSSVPVLDIEKYLYRWSRAGLAPARRERDAARAFLDPGTDTHDLAANPALVGRRPVFWAVCMEFYSGEDVFAACRDDLISYFSLAV